MGLLEYKGGRKMLFIEYNKLLVYASVRLIFGF